MHSPPPKWNLKETRGPTESDLFSIPVLVYLVHHMYVYVWCVHLSVWVHPQAREGREARAGCFIFLGKGLLLKISLLFQLGWQTSELLGTPICTPTSVVGVTGTEHSMLGFLCACWGFDQGSVIAEQTLLPTEPSAHHSDKRKKKKGKQMKPFCGYLDPNLCYLMFNRKHTALYNIHHLFHP